MSKTRVGFVLSLTAVAALTLVAGAVQGRLRNRWGPPETLLVAAKRLEDIPQRFGGPQNDSWRLRSADSMNPDTTEMLECTGYIVRTYENRRTGDVVSMFIIVGPAGPIAVHTPEICYATKNYKSRDLRARVAIADAAGHAEQFWALNFKSKTVQEDLLRVYYAWGTGGPWSAPNDARFAFAGKPYLYKIQLSSTLPRQADLRTNDPCRDFLHDFVPAARPYLIEPSKP